MTRTLSTVLAALAAYLLLIRPWHLRWGATDAEVGGTLAGDERVPNPVLQSTRAITIDAPAEVIWPWLAQMGWRRAGWYTYAFLDVFAFGLIAGVSQTLGFLRWPFLVPHLAQSYFAPGTSEAQRAAAGMVFHSFHRYAGMAVGEHLGYLSTSIWTLLIAVVILRTGVLPRWLGVSGAILAVGIAAGLLEPAGWELGGTINAISYLVWAVWLIAFGVTLLVRPVDATAGKTAPRLASSAVLN
ncbi:MAG TPA: DUF4386 domain-containing protein [Castellaniella sp.]|nr:DUF4386 domain-containing protein [Castellaniella sp.]